MILLSPWHNVDKLAWLMCCALYITHGHSRGVTSTFLLGTLVPTADRLRRAGKYSRTPFGSGWHVYDRVLRGGGCSRATQKNLEWFTWMAIRRLGLSRKGGAPSDNTHVSPHRVTFSFLFFPPLMSYFTTIPLTPRCPVSRLFVLTNTVFSGLFLRLFLSRHF